MVFVFDLTTKLTSCSVVVCGVLSQTPSRNQVSGARGEKNGKHVIHVTGARCQCFTEGNERASQ